MGFILLRTIPPLRQALIWNAGSVGIMRGVVEQHEPDSHGIPEVDDIQAGWRLVQAITVAARVETEEAAQHQSQGGFM